MQASPMFRPQYRRSSSAAASDPVQRYIDIALFDREIVEAVLDEDFEEAARLATVKLPCVDPEEVRHLDVVWVDQGDEFWIGEYDGWEMLHLKKNFPFYQA
ncbi:MAG: hypothetical protein LQ350_002634 [Teloschistes chrysophthalmus]|nr:MAG: hypothetical protein LQ350_002634 [Niorma chrysophthalma]